MDVESRRSAPACRPPKRAGICELDKESKIVTVVCRLCLVGIDSFKLNSSNFYVGYVGWENVLTGNGDRVVTRFRRFFLSVTSTCPLPEKN